MASIILDLDVSMAVARCCKCAIASGSRLRATRNGFTVLDTKSSGLKFDLMAVMLQTSVLNCVLWKWYSIMDEKSLQAWFKKECTERGALCYKFASPAHRGVPDVVVIQNTGRVYFVEMKSPKGTGRLSPLQEFTIKQFRAMGVDVYVCQTKEQCLATFGE